MKKILSCTLLAMSLCWVNARAEEGFWLQRQLEQGSDALRGFSFVKSDAPHGLPLPHIQRVSGKLNNCSTAFVSATGLLITSYHCVAPYLAASDGKEFVAQRHDTELPITDLELLLPQQTQDVTVTINRELSAEATPLLRSAKLQQLKTGMESDCEQQSGYRCELVSLHHGLEFYLIRYKVLRDLRLVYRPASADEVPERSWPRYSHDYVLLRAYVAGAQTSGVYASTNIPYQSEFARLSRQGVTENELVISPGFSPASQRYATEAEIRFNFELLYPRSVVYLEQAVSVIEQLAVPGSLRSEQYAPTLTELKQAADKVKALLAHYQRSSLLPLKQQRRNAVLEWINNSPVRQQLYGPLLDRLQQVLERQQAAAQRDLVLGFLKYAQLPALANQLYKLALQPDKLKTEQLRKQLSELDVHFDARVDMELALHFLSQYSQLPEAQRLTALDQYFALSDGFNREIVKHKLSAMYRGTTLTEPAKRLSWLERSAEQFQQSSDPLISFAVAMHDTVLQLAKQRNELQVELNSVRSAVMEVLLAFNDARGKATYAEANGALRFSVGRVSGYSPMDAVWYQPFSSLKNSLKQQPGIDNADTVARIPDIAVNFLSSIDSSSDYGAAPTFNAKGELVGIMFAGVQENLLADWHYDNALSRSVHVDSRFIIWQLQQTESAKALLAELLPGH
mgnify:CR=1 FL=1